MDDTKQQARELFLKAKVYRFFALFFAVAGVIVFLVVYSQQAGGDLMTALHNPLFVVFVLFPFIPSIVLSFKARSAEKKLQELLGKPQ